VVLKELFFQIEDDMKITRRSFFLKTLQSALLISVPSVIGSFLESCNNMTNPIGSGSTAYLSQVQGNTSGNIITLTVDSSSPVAKTGTAALVNYSGGQLLIDHPSDTQFNAFTSICTHAGCTVSGYDTSNNQFVCPCHGSRFDVNGHVAQGPASASLQQFQTKFSNNLLTITI
jgi:cytochrome b6-f complex iron-sulfur subunit